MVDQSSLNGMKRNDMLQVALKKTCQDDNLLKNVKGLVTERLVHTFLFKALKYNLFYQYI